MTRIPPDIYEYRIAKAKCIGMSTAWVQQYLCQMMEELVDYTVASGKTQNYDRKIINRLDSILLALKDELLERGEKA